LAGRDIRDFRRCYIELNSRGLADTSVCAVALVRPRDDPSTAQLFDQERRRVSDHMFLVYQSRTDLIWQIKLRTKARAGKPCNRRPAVTVIVAVDVTWTVLTDVGVGIAVCDGERKYAGCRL
jgi:hypothetical protein